MSNQQKAEEAIRGVLPGANEEWVQALATLVLLDWEEERDYDLETMAAYYADKVADLPLGLP